MGGGIPIQEMTSFSSPQNTMEIWDLDLLLFCSLELANIAKPKSRLLAAY